MNAQSYSWCTAPEAYSLATEAVWQARTLQFLSSLWNMEVQAGRTASDTSGVVIRQTFVTSYDLMSPRYKPCDGVHFVVLPLSYFDFAMLVWHAFGRWCCLAHQDRETVWDAVTAAKIENDPASQPDGWVLEVIVRQIAEPARDLDVMLPDATGLIARHVPFFARAVGRAPTSKPGSFDAHVSYVLADFTIAHEIGHRIAGDTETAASGDAYLAQEVPADRWGFDLFRASFGWRSEILESAPFDDAGQIMLGPILFLHTMRLRGQMAAALRRRRPYLYKARSE